jgi:hypothetical protein
MDITPIETRYAGCRFRSRLEARWAVFFDKLGVEWQYEPQGYVVNGKPYLPDFLLPKLQALVEVKGDAEQLDLELLSSLPASMDGVHHVLVLGPIPNPEFGAVPTHSMFTPVWDFHYLVSKRQEEQHKLAGPAFKAIEGLPDEEADAVRKFIRFLGSPSRNHVVHQRFFPVPSSSGFWPMVVGPANLVQSKADVLVPDPVKLYAVQPTIEAAYEAARSARFEHGESGA